MCKKERTGMEREREREKMRAKQKSNIKAYGTSNTRGFPFCALTMFVDVAFMLLLLLLLFLQILIKMFDFA